jgi:tetratricopeptide (TPR) repeat protein
VLAKQKEKLGPDHPNTLNTMHTVGDLYRQIGQPAEAVTLLKQVLTRRTAKLGLDHPYTLACMSDLADAYQGAGQSCTAVSLFEQALAKMKATLAPDHPDTLTTMSNLAGAYWEAGEPSKALPLLQEALAKRKAKFGPDHPVTLSDMDSLAWMLATCDDPGLRDPGRALELATGATKASPNRGDFWITLGAARYRAGDLKGSLQALDRSMRLRKGGNSSDWFFVAMAHARLGNKEQARKWYDQAVDWMEKNRPPDGELRRFRREAAILLGVSKSAATQGKQKWLRKE